MTEATFEKTVLIDVATPGIITRRGRHETGHRSVLDNSGLVFRHKSTISK
jgi:hypothetical protein